MEGKKERKRNKENGGKKEQLRKKVLHGKRENNINF